MVIPPKIMVDIRICIIKKHMKYVTIVTMRYVALLISRACVIRLQQIVNRQIMRRKENAQADDRHEKHRIVHGFSVPPEAYSSPVRPPPITAAGSLG